MLMEGLGVGLVRLGGERGIGIWVFCFFGVYWCVSLILVFLDGLFFWTRDLSGS